MGKKETVYWAPKKLPKRPPAPAFASEVPEYLVAVPIYIGMHKSLSQEKLANLLD